MKCSNCRRNLPIPKYISRTNSSIQTCSDACYTCLLLEAILFMNMSAKTQDELCQYLKVMVEECGPSNVKVFVPESWRGISKTNKLGSVDLLYHSKNSVIIHPIIGGLFSSTRMERSCD